MNKVRVLHLGCAHDSNDPRIRQKECVTLYQAGYDVVFMTSYQSLSDEDQSGKSQDGIIIKGGNYDTRGVLITRDAISFIKHRIKNKKKIVEQIVSESPDVLHVHELELMYVVNKVRRKLPNVKIIFDVHEDYPGSYYDVFAGNTNRFLAGLSRWYISGRLKKYLRLADAVITVTSSLLESLQAISNKDNVVLVCNYPMLHEKPVNGFTNRRSRQICYCGLLTENRGIGSLLDIRERINAEVHLAGPISDKYRRELEERFDWMHSNLIRYHGVISQEQVWDLNLSSMVGICCLKKTNNYYTSYPTKLFEYMMAGTPVVCSDFPVWKEIIEGADCGIAVDPENEDELVNAINRLLGDPQLSLKFGINGRKAVEEKYNWSIEAQKLLKLYEAICRESI